MRNVFKTLALAVAGALSLTSAALAEDTLSVRIGDLDLTRPYDAGIFKARLAVAVTQHCRDASAPDRFHCRHEARRELMRSLPAERKAELQIAKARRTADPVVVAAR